MNLPVAIAPPVEAEKYRRQIFPYSGEFQPIYDNDALIPVEDCQRLKLWLEASMVPATEAQAKQFSALLVGGYTKQQVNDPDAFMWHLRSAFERFPADIGAEVTRELPATQKWLDIASVNEMLEAKVLKRRAARDRVNQILHHHEMRRKRALEEAEAEKGREEYRRWLEANPNGTMLDYAKCQASKAIEEDAA